VIIPSNVQVLDSRLFDHALDHLGLVQANIFDSMAVFRMLVANIHHYAGRSDSLGINAASSVAGGKGQSRQSFEPLDSVQECFGPLFCASFWCRMNTRAFRRAASSGPR
jgi:hypothetical protein